MSLRPFNLDSSSSEVDVVLLPCPGWHLTVCPLVHAVCKPVPAPSAHCGEDEIPFIPHKLMKYLTMNLRRNRAAGRGARPGPAAPGAKAQRSSPKRRWAGARPVTPTLLQVAAGRCRGCLTHLSLVGWQRQQYINFFLCTTVDPKFYFQRKKIQISI